MTYEEIRKDYPVYALALVLQRGTEGSVLVRSNHATIGYPKVVRFLRGGPEVIVHHDDCPPRDASGGCE